MLNSANCSIPAEKSIFVSFQLTRKKEKWWLEYKQQKKSATRVTRQLKIKIMRKLMNCKYFLLVLVGKLNKFRYTEALQLTTDEDKALRPVLYRNRALARLKRDDFEGAQSDCNKALEFDGADVKALFRRSLAREQLGNVGPAFNDAKEALRLSPNDK